MRKIPAIIAISAIVILQACSKNSSNSIVSTYPNMDHPVLVNANVSAGASFAFTLGNTGTANIIKQAAHSQISEASTDENGALIYHYTPAANYSGTDEVEIVYTVAAGGSASGCTGGTSGEASGPSASTHYTIKFNVVD